MTARTAGTLSALALALGAAAPSSAQADAAWTCSASAGWLAAGGQRVAASGVGGAPCPVVRADAAPAAGAPGSLAVSGSMSTDGGAASQTTDTRKLQAAVDARSLTISNSDGSLVVSASRLRAQALGACDASRSPALTGSSSVGSVTLNARPVDPSRDYTEPGLGVNGAPLFGKLTIRFGEVVQSGSESFVRRAIHVVVTDRDGAVLFEGVGGEVAVGRSGPVCDPPPVCPPGQQPQAGRCVDLQVMPLPAPPPPAPPLTAPFGGGPPRPPAAHGCPDASARIGRVSLARLGAATLCLMNAERAAHRMRRLRASADLGLAAGLHARAMIAGRFFAHDGPAGLSFFDRILHSGYLARFGRWRVGENLGWGWGAGGTPAAMVAAWMRSTSHRRNILNSRFRDVGMAIRPGSPRTRARRQSVTYVVDFGGFQTTG